MLYEMLRPASRLWYALTMRDSGSSPRPRDAPRARSGASGADAVLLLGNGPCHGWGVGTHQLALTGALSRALASPRGCDIDYVGDESMSIASALAWLGDRDLSGYDVVTVVIGCNDALRLLSLAEWTTQLRKVLGALSAAVRPGARIVVAGVPPLRSIGFYDHPAALLGDLHAARLNRSTATIVAEYPSAEFVPLGALVRDAERALGSPAVYEALAGELAGPVRRAIDDARAASVRDLPLATPASEFEWSGMELAVELARSGGSPELQRITAEARDRFGVDIAAVSLIDGDRVWYATPYSLPSSIPAELSFCQYAVEGEETLVVPDSRKDARFSHNPLIDVAHIQFYAGHPLLSSDGRAIGTFCLFGGRPRSADSVDQDVLQQLALEAQRELWRLEEEAAVTQPETT